MSLQNMQSELAETLFTENEHSDLLQPFQHIAIHRNNMLFHLIQTLQTTYPLVEKLVGKDSFKAAAKEYIHCYPSRSGNLHDYGEYFCDFLKDYSPTTPYLSDVATFEWAYHILYFASDHAALSIKRLENVSFHQYEQLHFVLHPASRLLQFNWPILRIIELCNDEIHGQLHLNEECNYLLLIRPDTERLFLPLPHAEFNFLKSLNENQSLSAALESTLQIEPHFKLDKILSYWIKHKVIVDFHS